MNTALSTASSSNPLIPGFRCTAETRKRLPWEALAKNLTGEGVILLPDEEEMTVDQAEADLRLRSGMALVTHWMSLGIKFSKADVKAICERSTTAHAWMHKTITPTLKEKLGVHRNLVPMYKGFPKEVMEMDEAQLYMNAIMHYLGDYFGLEILPISKDYKRASLAKKENQERGFRVVSSDNVLMELDRYLGMNTVWSPDHVKLVQEAFSFFNVSDRWGTWRIPQRENKANLLAFWMMANPAPGAKTSQNGQTPQWALPVLKETKKNKQDPLPVSSIPVTDLSLTDVLRAVTVANGGDAALAATSPKVKLRVSRRSIRKQLLAAMDRAIEKDKAPLEELFQRRQAFLRLGEALHPGDYADRFRNVNNAFHTLRNEVAPPSWAGKLDAALLEKPKRNKGRAFDRIKELIEEHPGKAARALHRLLRHQALKDEERQALAETFVSVSGAVSTPLLLSTIAVFYAEQHAPKGVRRRAYFPKGSTEIRSIEGVTALPHSLTKTLIEGVRNTLRSRFAQLPPLGKVYVESGLDGLLIPKGLRTASADSPSISRGSWLPMDKEAKTLRFFLYWKHAGVDVDLAAAGYTANNKPGFGLGYNSDVCNFHNLKNTGMVHSGDFTNGWDGSTEYVDVTMTELNPETRYIGLAANVFSGPTFGRLQECFVGWQERGQPKRGEIMEPSTVKNKVRVEAGAKGFLGCIFDVKERRMLWLDMPFKSLNGHSILSNQTELAKKVNEVLDYAASQPKFLDLISLHIEARGGELVTRQQDADVAFVGYPKAANRAGQTVVAGTQASIVAGDWMPDEADIPRIRATLEAKAAEQAVKPALTEEPLLVIPTPKASNKVGIKRK